MSFWACPVSVSLRWLHMTHLQPVCIVSWPIQQSAILRNWRRPRKVRWHIMAVKRVSIMVCLVKHSQAHFHHLSPKAVDLPVSFIALSHEWQICLLKWPICAVHSPMHNLGMTNVGACNCFYPGHKGFTRLSRESMSRTKQQRFWQFRNLFLVSPTATLSYTAIFQTN